MSELIISDIGNNLNVHGRAVHRALMSMLETADHHNTNQALAADIERQLSERGYSFTPAPASEEGDGMPREFREYRAQGHGASRALLDAINYADELGDYDRMAWWLMIMLSNYGYWISKGASARCWKEWDEL